MAGLIRFRWIAILFLFLGVLPLWKWGYLQKQNLPYFLGVLALLGVFNVLSEALEITDESVRQRKLLLHLWVDLLAAAGLLFVSGSANNPFISILCVHAFLGGMLLRHRLSYVFGVTVLCVLGLLQFETFLDARVTLGSDHQQLFLAFLAQWVLVLASWWVSHYFSRLMQKHEIQIRQLQERQFQADRLKALGALTAGFSHQLATPMNSLKLRMERGLRKLEVTDTTAIAEFKKAQDSLQDCLRVFEHMASVFSVSSQAEVTQVDLSVLIRDLLKVWAKENPETKVEEVFLDGSFLCRVQVLAFSQTFFDLLDNAREASFKDHSIQVRLYKKDRWAFVEVRDQGAGLTNEILGRLGEPFVTSKVDGNGLGLYAAMMMAQSVGGEFKISNNTPHPGATAQIQLPLEVL